MHKKAKLADRRTCFRITLTLLIELPVLVREQSLAPRSYILSVRRLITSQYENSD